MAMVSTVLEVIQLIASAVATLTAFQSARYWNKSADVKMPPVFNTRADFFLGDTQRDHTELQELDLIYEALRDQGFWNSEAASTAAIAAGSAAVAFLISIALKGLEAFNG